MNSTSLASFPGSPTSEREQWDGESLAFFLTWAVSKVDRGRETLIVREHTEVLEAKRAKVARPTCYMYLAIGVEYNTHCA